MIYSDNTYGITNNIATYTRRDFKTVFDTTSNKWYMLNNLDNYEEYGIYGDSFDTYYQGKLVIVNDHEYEWDGTEWIDLGTDITIVTSVYRDSTHTGYIKFPYTTSEVSSIEVTFKQNTADTNFLIATGATKTNRWRVFYGGGTLLMYDAGDTRWQASGSEYFNKKLHLRFDGNPMRLYNYDTQTYLYTGTSTRPTGRNFYWGYYELDWEGTGISNTPGWLYDDVILYSDNGVTAIAHYIPYIQNGVAGLYDIINESFLAPIGLLGAETTTRRPKDYPEKAAPTITTLWASTIYRNSAHLTTLMRNDAEMAKIDYMSDDILKKGEASLPIDYLCFEANTAGSTIALSNTNISPNIEYSRDKNTWTTWNYSALTLQNVGDKIYMRGSNPNGIG